MGAEDRLGQTVVISESDSYQYSQERKGKDFIREHCLHVWGECRVEHWLACMVWRLGDANTCTISVTTSPHFRVFWQAYFERCRFSKIYSTKCTAINSVQLHDVAVSLKRTLAYGVLQSMIWAYCYKMRIINKCFGREGAMLNGIPKMKAKDRLTGIGFFITVILACLILYILSFFIKI